MTDTKSPSTLHGMSRQATNRLHTLLSVVPSTEDALFLLNEADRLVVAQRQPMILQSHIDAAYATLTKGGHPNG